MTGIYPPSDHCLLVVEIDADTAETLQSYMDDEGVELREAVRRLIDYGVLPWKFPPKTTGQN